jgi:hypothetical protein
MKPLSIINGLAASVMAGLLFGCSTTRIYPIPFSKAESLLFENLHVDQDEILKGSQKIQDMADGDLKKVISRGPFYVKLSKYVTGKRLWLTCESVRYRGFFGETVWFELISTTGQSTRITVYADRPLEDLGSFFYFRWRIGAARESRIHDLIWSDEAAIQVLAKMTHKLENPQH